MRSVFIFVILAISCFGSANDFFNNNQINLLGVGDFTVHTWQGDVTPVFVKSALGTKYFGIVKCTLTVIIKIENTSKKIFTSYGIDQCNPDPAGMNGRWLGEHGITHRRAKLMPNGDIVYDSDGKLLGKYDGLNIEISTNLIKLKGNKDKIEVTQNVCPRLLSHESIHEPSAWFLSNQCVSSTAEIVSVK